MPKTLHYYLPSTAFNNSENNDILGLKNTLKSKLKDYRMLFSFREEYLPQLESLKKKIPSIRFTNSRFRLEPFSIKIAKVIILNTAGINPETKQPVISESDASVVSKNLAAKILGFDEPMDDPFLLSVICQGIYPDLVSAKNTSESYIKSLVDNAVKSYIKKIYSEISEPTKKFIEKSLITADGTKNYVNYIDIKKNTVLGKDIDKLIDDQDFRLLSKGQFLESEQVSILHDRLLPPLLEFKSKREEKEKRISAKRFIGAVLIIAAISSIALLTHTYQDKIKIIDDNLGKAHDLIEDNQNFIDAYSFIKAVNNTKTIYVPDNIINRKITPLGTTLLFHLITPRIEINSNFIFYKDANTIKVRKVAGLKMFKSLLLDTNTTNFGFSINTPRFWIAYNKDPLEKDAIFKYEIDRNLKTTKTFVDRTYTPSADYDNGGNLYYLKNDSIWIHCTADNKPLPFLKIHEFIKDNTNKSVELKFLPKEDKIPSNFLKISIKDCSCTQVGIDPMLTFIVNIENKDQIKIPHGIDFYVNGNSSIFYTTLNKNVISINDLVLGKSISDTKVPIPFNSKKDYFVDALRYKEKIKKLKQPDTSMFAGGKFGLSYDGKRPNELKINKNGKEFKKISLGKIDSIITFEALNNYFVYLHQKNFPKKRHLNPEQLVVFETYDTIHKQQFHIPKNWKFYYFKDSIMVFKYNDNHFTQLGILVTNYDMTHEMSHENWNNWYRLLDSLALENQNKRTKDSITTDSLFREQKKKKSTAKKMEPNKTKSQLITFCSK